MPPTDRWRKMQNAAHRLNTECAKTEHGYIIRRGQIVGFQPCAKAHVFLAALYGQTGRPEPYCEPWLAEINTDTALMAVVERAALTPCGCHTSITVDQLIEYQFDDSYRDSSPIT